MPENRQVRQDAVALADSLLRSAIRQGASDLHIEPRSAGLRIRQRLDGVLCNIDELPVALGEGLVTRLKVMAGLLTYRVDVPQEGSFSMEDPAGSTTALDVRVATFPTIWGERAVVRFFRASTDTRHLQDLGLDDQITQALRRAAERPGGLMLVTGPAGAGKSTTLYAIARHSAEDAAGRSVISLEDPVEQRLESVTQIQIQPFGELNYVRAMRSLLRQDAQVLLVGEVRDAETAHVVVEAALTGHLVVSTMHSGDPAEAIARLLEMGIAPYQLVSSLYAVCAQRLLRLVCAQCRGQGCGDCLGTGFRGRWPCAQLAVMNEALRAAVLERASTEQLRRLIEAECPSLMESASRMVAIGRTTQAEIGRVLGEVPS